MQIAALRALEFDRIVEAVRGYALTPMGDERLGRRGSAEPVEDSDTPEPFDASARATALVLPEGTELRLILEGPLSSTSSPAGDPIS